MMVVISYDVSTSEDGQSRLRKVAKTCQNYGQRVQKSVFECIVDPAQWIHLKTELARIINKETDSLRFYLLGSNWRRRIEYVGVQKSLDQEGPLIV